MKGGQVQNLGGAHRQALRDYRIQQKKKTCTSRQFQTVTRGNFHRTKKKARGFKQEGGRRQHCVLLLATTGPGGSIKLRCQKTTTKKRKCGENERFRPLCEPTVDLEKMCHLGLILKGINHKQKTLKSLKGNYCSESFR